MTIDRPDPPETPPPFDTFIWVAKLANALIEPVDAYYKAPDEALARREAANIQLIVLEALEQFGVLRQTKVHLVLLRFVEMVNELERGRIHPWAHTISVGGTKFDTDADTNRRFAAIECVFSLIKTGRTQNDACMRVSELISKCILKRTPNWKTISSWYHERNDPRYAGLVDGICDSRDYKRSSIDELFELMLSDEKCDHGGSLLECPETGGQTCPALTEYALARAEKVFRQVR